jgi:hypothetical protein
LRGEATLVESQRRCDATHLALKAGAHSNPPDSAPASSDTLTQLELREAERGHALLLVREALDTIEARGGPPDRWESAFLLYAIDMLARGQYGYALHFVEQAMTPAAERTRLDRPSDKCFDWVGISTLKYALGDAQAQPILREPDFRPSPLCLQPDLLGTRTPAGDNKPAHWIRACDVEDAM